ncbi:hypothetical protein G195_005605 [Phytophthora kernoviae 00238/432]|uniref:Prolyl 4-hydroxylase alpha subunit domain-containing protein n=1 Tax=Phytophthora kernoviae 00238/432 TaxID=1284355 RepID=A0A8J4SFY0_9STRA|nr:hypothetical protein G195_005605 [Phytophthora kernoviae 00238/432]
MSKKNTTETPASSGSESASASKLTTKKSSSYVLPLVSAAVVALAIGAAKYADVPLNADGLQTLVDQISTMGKPGLVDSTIVGDALPDKYETSLVDMDVRHLVNELVCNDTEYSVAPLFDGKTFHVTEPMETQQPMGDDRVFFMLNGRNDGVYMSWNGDFECVGQAAEMAAAWLGADRDDMVNGVRLYSQMGWPVRNAAELSATKNIVHVLLDFQLWQWPGIKKGYKYVLEDGVTLTMVGMSPKVLDVEYFLTQEEADKVIEIGSPKLDRSKVDGSNSSKVVTKSRTSHTAFLPDSYFTRDFMTRSARVARLPSPSFVERMQLVRYAAGEFYRQHFDTFHSREFLPKGANSYVVEDYKEWAKWAAEKLRSLDQSKVPEEFREGGLLFPDAEDQQTFPNALLEVFFEQMNSTNMFTALYDAKQNDWIRTNLDDNAVNMIPDLMDEKRRPSYLPRIVKAWEKKLGLGELRYTFPKHESNSVSHFFHWVRWAKERVSFLGDKAPAVVRPDGMLYPRYTVEFQEELLKFILDDYTKGFIVRMTNNEWYDWMVTNRGRNHVLFQVMQVWPQFAELVIRTWEAHVGNAPQLRYTLPGYIKHFHPQRYVTLFLYLNNQTKVGGETVFPFSLDRYSDEKIQRDGMDECSSGLAVPPLGLHASLFYVQTPEGDTDDMSRHGGCPPHEGVKWGANSFITLGVLPDKYETSLVDMDVRHLVNELVCNDTEYSVAPLFDGKTFHVTEPMETQQPMGDDRVFFMLNGRNDGVYMSWNGDFECVGQAAEMAAAWLGADRDDMVNGVRLYSQMGWPVRNAAELSATKNIVHVLLDFQLWQWPGIKKGYKYVLEDGVTLTVVGINPKVLDVKYFLTQEEADKVIELGLPNLDRSKVDSNNSSVVSKFRTSHTAFLPDNHFTRDFRTRSARVARLPSATFSERLQLVRYNAGEFYRKHLDTFDSREFLPKAASHAFGVDAYKQWTIWAAGKIRELSQQRDIPEDFREGGSLFPNAEDNQRFPNALAKMFYTAANESNLFKALSDEDWLSWLDENVNNNAYGILDSLFAADKKPEYLPLLVKTWEDTLGIPELQYTFPKPPMNSISHFFAWVRWAKERVAFLDNKVPALARPSGELYPKFTVEFQEKLLAFILDDYSREYITRITSEEWYTWMVENRGRNHVMFNTLKNFPQFAELTIKTWEASVNAPFQLRYKLPVYVKDFHPQRYATLFLYLNNQTKVGGETVFPFSLDRYSDETIFRDGMDECSSGLAVPPLSLHASLFYVQTPEGDVDHMSRHGGCPPHEGTKWGSNSFMWDSDADEAAELWTTK